MSAAKAINLLISNLFMSVSMYVWFHSKIGKQIQSSFHYFCNMMRNKNWLLALIGAAAGTALGWLLFSENGKKLRADSKQGFAQWLKKIKGR